MWKNVCGLFIVRWKYASCTVYISTHVIYMEIGMDANIDGVFLYFVRRM